VGCHLWPGYGGDMEINGSRSGILWPEVNWTGEGWFAQSDGLQLC